MGFRSILFTESISLMIRNKTLLTIIAVLTSIQFAFCQADKNDLYLQTSEVNDIMVHYNADHGIIMRFYSTSGNRSEWWNNQYGDNYNSPERRQRLLRTSFSRRIRLNRSAPTYLQPFHRW